ncbi:hypothetical protein skT53_14530 [Effusibacillus dendaii]|uniref:LexA repressor DNA-binding domain-containing protein n=1 Tax=Effusibacillus dendaii TaxID=2743772 RepID=A0A7I8D8K5_9BACL|nr:hypothetical protein skT53_14530 [Effusibacillus dendaii]
MNLTNRQNEILDYIKQYIAKKGYPPTCREIGKGIYLSTSSVHKHLATLEEKGVIQRDPETPRAIRVLV